MNRVIVGAAIVAALLCAPALAQSVEYDGVKIAPDPGSPVQCIFWDRDEVRHEDPNGVTLDVTGSGLVIINDVEHGWIVAGKVALDSEKIATLQVGDDCANVMREG